MVIQSKNVWISGQFMAAQLQIEGNIILQVLPYGHLPADWDYGELRLVPGFIDEHTHGGYGFDTNDACPNGLKDWLRQAPTEGITSLLATTITQSEPVLTAAVANVASVASGSYDGSEILGIHLEGPYLSMEYKGAQPPEYILSTQLDQFQRYQKAADGRIRLVTLAPEADPDFQLSRYCSQQGIAVNLGHTNCTYEQAVLGSANGITGCTHTYNAMSPFRHRQPGAVGGALHCHDLYSEIIPDGLHCHFASLGLLFDCKGPNRAILITDSMRAKGKTADHYLFGGQQVVNRKGGGVALASDPDTLAGSTLKLNEGLRNTVEKAGVSFASALEACTINPARHLGLDRKKGRLATGWDADIVVLDRDYNVLQTYCRGKTCLSS